MRTLENKAHNLKRAEQMVREAAQKADLIVLPEMFGQLYLKEHMLNHKEPVDDFEVNEEATSARLLSSLA